MSAVGNADAESPSEKKTSSYATLSVHPHGHRKNDPTTGAVVVPISLATTFEQPAPGVALNGYEYARSDNPTRHEFEQTIARLEHGDYGLAFSSGSAALTCITHLCPAKAHMVCVDDVYGGTRRYLSRVAQLHGDLRVDFIDLQHDPAALVCAKIHESLTHIVWIETPTNPTLRLVDIAAVARKVRQVRAEQETKWPILVVDNTFLSPVFQNPLLLGADLVTHSVSKYLNGHSDVIMGAVVGLRASSGRDKEMHGELEQRLRFLQNALGPVPSPFDCYLALRGMRTLHLRMQQHQRNATAIAVMLSKDPRVDRVYYPGLPSHPQHALALKQQGGFGGVLSFSIRNGAAEHARRFCQGTRVFTLAESLGCVESLCEVPAIMTHAAVGQEARAALGITDSFIRLSVGIEDTDDLVADISQALDAAFA